MTQRDDLARQVLSGLLMKTLATFTAALAGAIALVAVSIPLNHASDAEGVAYNTPTNHGPTHSPGASDPPRNPPPVPRPPGTPPPRPKPPTVV